MERANVFKYAKLVSKTLVDKDNYYSRYNTILFFYRYENDTRFVNPASDNTDDMPNDNDVQPTTQIRHLLEATSQYTCTLNRNASFKYLLVDDIK